MFESLERAAAVTPFTIGIEEFESLFLLVDGIYPPYSRFVRGIKTPITLRHHVFTKWQEAARKDVERCFGVLKGQWQFLARPILTIDLDILSSRVYCCLCLHNMNVTERIMGNIRTRYRPSASLGRDTAGRVRHPPDLAARQAESFAAYGPAETIVSTVGVRNAPPSVQHWATNHERKMNLRRLQSVNENVRLSETISEHIYEHRNIYRNSRLIDVF
jgi:hypothetical protein